MTAGEHVKLQAAVLPFPCPPTMCLQARDRAGRPGCDDACRESASAVAALAKKLPFAMDRLFSAASNFVTAQVLALAGVGLDRL